jgi:hypothetical protein
LILKLALKIIIKETFEFVCFKLNFFIKFYKFVRILYFRGYFVATDVFFLVGNFFIKFYFKLKVYEEFNNLIFEIEFIYKVLNQVKTSLMSL